MNCEELSTNLRDTAELLRGERITEIDFSNLATQLAAVVDLLRSAEKERRAGAEMLAHFRSELRRRAQATAKLSGKSSALIERLIESKDLSFADLVALRRQIDTEFDNAFSSTLTEPLPAARGDENVAAFKS